jgi:hypothetical protein
VNDRAIRKLAADLVAAHERVKAVYLVGSRARGEARADSDYDLIAVVSGCRQSGWRAPGHAPIRGFPTNLDGVPIDWCLIPHGAFSESEIANPAGVRLAGQAAR